MLHWRLILGSLLIAIVAALAWLDFDSERPGLVMAPLALVGSLLAAGELVRLLEENEQTPAPSRWVVVPGAVATVLVSCAPMCWPRGAERLDAVQGVGWIAVGLAAAGLVVSCAEMLRFREPGSATSRLALAIFGMAYAGGLMGFVVQLRVLRGEPWGEEGRWGMVALISLVVAVKSNDIGAYITGRLFGQTKMAPVLSPQRLGKAWAEALFFPRWRRWLSSAHWLMPSAAMRTAA